MAVFASGRALLTDTANKDCSASGLNGTLVSVISIVGLNATSLPSATACRSAPVTESISVTATIFPFRSTMMVVGLDSTPYRPKTAPEASTPTQPDIFFLVKKISTAFKSSSSIEMNWNFAGSSDSTSWLRCGRLATQGGHQVGQNSSTTN